MGQTLLERTYFGIKQIVGRTLFWDKHILGRKYCGTKIEVAGTGTEMYNCDILRSSQDEDEDKDEDKMRIWRYRRGKKTYDMSPLPQMTPLPQDLFKWRIHF